MVLNKEFLQLLHLSPQMFGLALSSSISIVHQLTGLVVSVVGVEQEFISVERIARCLEFTAETEIDGEVETKETSDETVLDGDIQFKHLSVHYGDLIAIKDVTLSIPRGSRVMVVGRTGNS